MWTPCAQGPGAVSPVLPPELQALGAGVKDHVGTAARGAPDCARPAWAPGPLNAFSLSHGSGVDALLLPLPAVGAALAVEQHSLGRKARAQAVGGSPQVPRSPVVTLPPGAEDSATCFPTGPLGPFLRLCPAAPSNAPALSPTSGGRHNSSRLLFLASALPAGPNVFPLVPKPKSLNKCVGETEQDSGRIPPAFLSSRSRYLKMR